MAALLNKGAVLPCKAPVKASRKAVVVKAQAVDRRALLGMIASTTLLANTPASYAAYGESANVFGRVTNNKGFVPYAGDGFSLALPSKWNPSREQDFPGVILRYEDNGDAVNNFVVIRQATSKSSIEEYGSPEAFLNEFSYLLGRQSFEGETLSEGGFAPNRVSAASVLGVDTVTDKKGKAYYTLDILTRTADGDEGGRHQLIKATISNGQLYILKVQAGDKRWFKGASKDCKNLQQSFTVA